MISTTIDSTKAILCPGGVIGKDHQRAGGKLIAESFSL